MSDDSTLNKIFDIDPSTVAIDTDAQSLTLPPTTANTAVVAVGDHPDEDMILQLDADVQYARTVMKDGIEQVREAMKSAILLAQSGDSPRAFEVVGNMLTSIINANKELTALHKTKEDTIASHKSRVQDGASDKSGGDVHIEKAVFIGRAADLLRELKQMQKANVIDVTPAGREDDAKE